HGDRASEHALDMTSGEALRPTGPVGGDRARPRYIPVEDGWAHAVWAERLHPRVHRAGETVELCGAVADDAVAFRLTVDQRVPPEGFLCSHDSLDLVEHSVAITRRVDLSASQAGARVADFAGLRERPDRRCR